MRVNHLYENSDGGKLVSWVITWRYDTKHGYNNDKGVRNQNKLKLIFKFQGHIPAFKKLQAKTCGGGG